MSILIPTRASPDIQSRPTALLGASETAFMLISRFTHHSHIHFIVCQLCGMILHWFVWKIRLRTLAHPIANVRRIARRYLVDIYWNPSCRRSSNTPHWMPYRTIYAWNRFRFWFSVVRLFAQWASRTDRRAVKTAVDLSFGQMRNIWQSRHWLVWRVSEVSKVIDPRSSASTYSYLGWISLTIAQKSELSKLTTSSFITKIKSFQYLNTFHGFIFTLVSQIWEISMNTRGR